MLVKLFVAGFVVVIVGMLAFFLLVFEGPCPYGQKNSSGRSVVCKPRPQPTPEQTAALMDGSGAKRAISAFRASEDGKGPLIGVGFNRWAETTFSLPTDEKNFMGKPEQRYVTYDVQGELADDSNPEKREYVLADGAERIDISDFDTGPLLKALARVRKLEPRAVLDGAKFGAEFKSPDVLWYLTFALSATELVPETFNLEMRADGSGLCLGFGSRVELKGIKECPTGGLVSSEGGGSTGKPQPPAGVPAVPKAITDQAECVQKAGTDVVALQKCVTGG